MRTAIKDFALANRLYAGATVTFYTVSGGAKTATKATLYVGATGSSTLGNPQVLGSDGKLRRAVYVDVPTIATVSGLTVPDHDTGIINPAPSFRISPTTFELEYSYDGGTTWTSSASTLFKHRGAWVTATAYARTDTFTDSGTLYYVVTAHTSAASLATDVSAGRVVAVSSLTLPLSLANGGTGSSYANAAALRTGLAIAGSGAVTGSGLTQATGKLLGRITAGSGAIEEINPGSGLALSGTDLNVDVTELTEDTAPDTSTDYLLTYDASATANKKVKLSNVSKFSKAYTSSDQTITAAALLTLAHSLGTTPSLVQLFAVCVTAEAGYSIGDVILLPPGADPTNAVNRVMSVWIDSTNVNVRFGSANPPFILLHKTTGALAVPTAANWNLRVKAWA